MEQALPFHLEKLVALFIKKKRKQSAFYGSGNFTANTNGEHRKPTILYPPCYNDVLLMIKGDKLVS